jgi:hypothetical protein
MAPDIRAVDARRVVLDGALPAFLLSSTTYPFLGPYLAVLNSSEPLRVLFPGLVIGPKDDDPFPWHCLGYLDGLYHKLNDRPSWWRVVDQVVL